MSVGGARPSAFLCALKLCERTVEQLRPGELMQVLHGLKGLAPWWLCSDVLARAPQQEGLPPYARPDLPETAGSCWIILAQPDSRPWPLLRNAMLLPLEWRRDTTDSVLLPAQLRDLAGEITRALEKPGWGLHLSSAAGLGEIPLRDASEQLDFPSGWPALAAGLLVADEGGRPNRKIWATGSWDRDGGILRVDRLVAKLALGREWGAEICFVPGGQLHEVAPFTNGITLRPLQQGTAIVRLALGEYTYRLEGAPLPPANAHDDAAFDRCADFWERNRSFESKKVFYWTHLLSTIIGRHRERLEKHYAGWNCSDLVTIVSGSYELVPMVAESIRCKRCLLLYTSNKLEPKKDQTKAMLAVKARLENRDGADPIHCVPGEFEDSERMTEQIPALIEAFLRETSVEEAVYDVTPGLGWMRWVADHAMPVGSWRVYVHHDSLTPVDQKPKPGSERLVVWRA